ncbi:MAG: F0F1 ATP synthase subunit delta [Mariprofundus sp.]|nr:F0F1 ATP synthase subunit delta [Mariprofundus sp.]
MSTSKISRRYASALFDLINEGVKLQADLATVSEVAANDQVCALLTCPDYPASVKCNVISKASGGAVCSEIERLLAVLAERNKLSLLPEINAQVEVMVHQADSQLDAEVTVATVINAATQTKLSKALEASTGKQVTLSVCKDKSILGGMIIRIGDRKIDYSLRTKLAGMRRALAS